MLILTIRTDKPESEIGLYDGDQQKAYEIWLAHRQLAESIHLKIKDMLDGQKLTLENIGGVVAYGGPGSFTGLRIGLSVANSLAAGLSAPIVMAQSETWINIGVKRLGDGADDKVAVPQYGAPVHIIQQKH